MKIHKLTPQYLKKIWGMSQQIDCQKQTVEKIGEIWLVSAQNKALSRFKDGTDLKTYFQSHPERFNNFQGEYPLLIKAITPQDYLSIQVHPDDDYAKTHHQSLGKPESWYIFDAPKDARIIYGHTAKTKVEIKEMIETKSWDQCLKKVPVKRGDFLYVPPGKIHAITPGVVVYEIQRSSDITYRIYDFDRLDENNKKRELHIKQSLDVITVPDTDLPIINKKSGFLTINPYFSIYFWDVQIKAKLDLRTFRPYWLQLIICDGKGQINSKPFKSGDAAITLDKIQPLFGTGNLKVLISWISLP